jgi:hypothetical protein
MHTRQHTPPPIFRRARRYGALLIALMLLALSWAGAGAGTAAAAGPTAYYVDCAAGNDSNSGASVALAWKSLAKANAAKLRPGDSLLLKRGCAWTGPLKAHWNGTAAQPILIGAYGSGARPRIQNGAGQNVDITGTYQVIENLEAFAKLATVDPGCNNQPVGWIIGFNFRGSAAYNTLRGSKASGHTAGVRLSNTTHHNKVLHNELVGNNVMQRLDRTSNNDLGAWGIVLNGNDSEIAYNYLSGNNAICSYDFSAVGNAIELYEAQRNSIHHNLSVDDRVFSELGGSASRKAQDNVFAYNIQASSFRSARFLVLKGAKSQYGPAWRTRAYNNTVYLTDAASQGVVCSAGCGPEVLTLNNNIIWAEKKAAYADGPFNESNNIYWNKAGAPYVQFLGASMSPTSRKVNPLFVNPQARDFHLQASSRAIDAGGVGVLSAGYAVDFDQTPVPQNGKVDVGAFEYRSR